MGLRDQQDRRVAEIPGQAMQITSRLPRVRRGETHRRWRGSVGCWPRRSRWPARRCPSPRRRVGPGCTPGFSCAQVPSQGPFPVGSTALPEQANPNIPESSPARSVSRPTLLRGTLGERQTRLDGHHIRSRKRSTRLRVAARSTARPAAGRSAASPSITPVSRLNNTRLGCVPICN